MGDGRARPAVGDTKSPPARTVSAGGRGAAGDGPSDAVGAGDGAGGRITPGGGAALGVNVETNGAGAATDAGGGACGFGGGLGA